MKNAYFAGGCFWCISYVFESLKGVKDVISGFSGGSEVDPSYEEVKSQNTQHRETIKIIYDENICTFEKLLKIFIDNVDPFDPDGQFIDRGRSYSLAIYYNDEQEYQISKDMIDKLQKESNKEVFISLEKYQSFYEAEEYHQHYALKNKEAFEEELISSGRKKS
ncbi:MAG: peptide-methionine (S)-S-oxide reductase MsrA [Bacilli bacterium]|nr:peptide-methionine (S)-S-oxide reductase MsrA [Bacilli bacterium]